MSSIGKMVCITCREVNKPGHNKPTCNLVYAGTKWRPPKKNNDRAWKRMEENLLWDDKSLANMRPELLDWKHAQHLFPQKFLGRNKSAAPKQHKPYTYTRKHWRKWITEAKQRIAEDK